VFKTRCGWVQHEGGHLSLTGVKSIDRGIQVVTMGFGGGASSTLWNSMHHKHHAAPQRVNYDIDLDTTPFVAFFKGAFENSSRITISSSWLSDKIARIWMRLQAWLFLPVTNGIAPATRASCGKKRKKWTCYFRTGFNCRVSCCHSFYFLYSSFC